MRRNTKEEIKNAKRNHKRSLENRDRFNESRDKMLSNLFGYKLPKWGAIKVKLINW